MVRDGHEPDNRSRLASGAREEIQLDSDQIAGPIFGEGGGPGRVVSPDAKSHTRTASQQATCLGAKELRPGRADPPRRRPKTRAAKDGRDGRG